MSAHLLSLQGSTLQRRNLNHAAAVISSMTAEYDMQWQFHAYQGGPQPGLLDLGFYHKILGIF